MAFYHEKKEHLSPSAMQAWHNSRSGFIKSYYKGEKGIETKAMSFGTKIHALIEGGMLEATQVYAHNEAELKFEVEEGTGLYFMGKPDSYSDRLEVAGKSSVEFVDYKSGKTNGWEEKLPIDIKMFGTAWLVWMATGKPDEVLGYIEFIETVWNPETHDIELVEKETVVMGRQYTAQELQAFTKGILKTMADINAFYEKWTQSSGEFVNDADIEQALEISGRIDKLEEELKEVHSRIASQMEFGGEENHKVEGRGTFYFKPTQTWDYPPELEFTLDGSEVMTLGKADRIASGAKAAKTNYELVNEPATSKLSFAFRKIPAKKIHAK